MSPLNNKTVALAAAWLAALGGLGTSTLGVAVAQTPGTDAPAAIAPASDAPVAPAAAPNPKPLADAPPTVLLRTNGKVLQGEIRRDANGYVVKTKVGVMLFNRREVERTFRSMAELYTYKASLCPEDDADERLKLATWCLEQKLKEEAKVQLAAVLLMSPENRRAKAMMANLDRPASPNATRDDGLLRASAEVPAPLPADLDLERLREAQARNPRPSGLPVIFNLEPGLAVRRYQEFAATVHPMLQHRCAKCHNEVTPGDFQLIQTRTRKDLSNDLVLRANLEAALRIVTSDDLSRSPILTASGMTHGNGGKPVLGGPASPEYKTLAAWVTSLRPAQAKDANPRAAARPAASGDGGEAFANGRRPSGADPAMPPSPNGPKTLRTPPHSGVDNGQPSAGFPGDEPSTPPGVRAEDAKKYREAVASGYLPQAVPGTRPEDAEVVLPRITRPGQIAPGSQVGMPANAPGDREFVPIAEQQRRLARKLGTDGVVDGASPRTPLARKTNAAPGAPNGLNPSDEDMLAGSGTPVAGIPGAMKLPSGEVVMRLPNGEIVKVATNDPRGRKKDDPAKPSRIDLKKLKVINPKVADDAVK